MAQTPTEIQVNVVLEESPSDAFNQQFSHYNDHQIIIKTHSATYIHNTINIQQNRAKDWLCHNPRSQHQIIRPSSKDNRRIRPRSIANHWYQL